MTQFYWNDKPNIIHYKKLRHFFITILSNKTEKYLVLSFSNSRPDVQMALFSVRSTSLSTSFTTRLNSFSLSFSINNIIGNAMIWTAPTFTHRPAKFVIVKKHNLAHKMSCFCLNMVLSLSHHTHHMFFMVDH